MSTPKKPVQTAEAPDWASKCDVCGSSPVMPETGMCGPCSTGEADTALGDW